MGENANKFQNLNYKDVVKARKMFKGVKDARVLEGLSNEKGEVDQSMLSHFQGDYDKLIAREKKREKRKKRNKRWD